MGEFRRLVTVDGVGRDTGVGQQQVERGVDGCEAGRALLRGGAADSEISETIRGVWGSRGDRYSEVRFQNTPSEPKVEMSRMGG